MELRGLDCKSMLDSQSVEMIPGRMVEMGDSFHPWEQWWPVSEGEELVFQDSDNCLLDNLADALIWPPER